MMVTSASESDKAKVSNSDPSRREKRGKLRVCILLPRLKIGGAKVQVLHLLKDLDKSSFTVFLICMQTGEGMMENEAQGKKTAARIARIYRTLFNGKTGHGK